MTLLMCGQYVKLKESATQRNRLITALTINQTANVSSKGYWPVADDVLGSIALHYTYLNVPGHYNYHFVWILIVGLSLRSASEHFAMDS